MDFSRRFEYINTFINLSVCNVNYSYYAILATTESIWADAMLTEEALIYKYRIKYGYRQDFSRCSSFVQDEH